MFKCYVSQFNKMVGGKWKLLIIERLRKRDVMRFGQLAASIPEISRKVLSNQLKSMEKDKLIIRKQYNKIPPHVEYSLTDKSKRLCNVFKTICYNRKIVIIFFLNFFSIN